MPTLNPRDNDRPYPVLDLFAGIGGFTLAFEAVEYANRLGLAGRDAPIGEGYRRRMGTAPAGSSAFRTIAFSEIDPYASALLAHRFPAVPNLGPVQSVTRDSVLARCGELPVVVTGGFPCQPHSLAGKRGSVIDERDLWDECVRVLRDIRPRFALFENVAGLLTSGSYTDAADGELGAGLFLNRVCSDLAAIRYACQWQVVSAADVGAPHRRDRIWLLCVDELADSHGVGRAYGQPHVHATDAGVDALRDLAASGDAGLADASGVRHNGRAVSHGVDTGGISLVPQRDSARDEAVGRGARGANAGPDWPAAHGLWPARPGQRQFGWEPSRVVGDAATKRLSQPEPESGDARRVGQREEGTAPAIGTRLAGADGRQTESELGGNASRFSYRMDSTADEVREAEGGEVMWATPRAGQSAGSHDVEWEPGRKPMLNGKPISTSLTDQIRLSPSSGTADPSDAVNRVPRLKALGNAIVPAVAHIFALAIYEQLSRDLTRH